MQSLTVPFNSTPVANVRTTLNPNASISICNHGASRLLQVTIILPGFVKMLMKAKMPE
jgi:hypothetical protein